MNINLTEWMNLEELDLCHLRVTQLYNFHSLLNEWMDETIIEHLL